MAIESPKRSSIGERWRDDLDRSERFVLCIARVDPRGRFDEDSLPELDAFVKCQSSIRAK